MIKDILNFENFKSRAEVENKLEEISRKLFYFSELHTKSNKYLITQIELFFSQRTNSELSTKKCGNHPLQSTIGKFHIHKTIKNNKLKSPKNIGLDITCGKEFERYGGILIRAIKNINSEVETFGPSNVLNELINNDKSKGEKFSDDIKLTLFNLDGLDIYTTRILTVHELGDHSPLFTDILIDENKATSRFSKLFTSQSLLKNKVS